MKTSYIDQTISKIDKLYQKNHENVIVYPNFLCQYDGNVFIGSAEKEELKKYLKQMRELAYVGGFWYGWSLKEMEIKKHDNTRTIPKS